MAIRQEQCPNVDKPPAVFLVSACLAGCATNLCASHSRHPLVEKWVKDGLAVPVCPEQLGGLPTPRMAAEIQGGDGAAVLTGMARVHRKDGTDVTDAFLEGARQTLMLACSLRPRTIVLKERSPSCGVHEIYDGQFTRTRIQGSQGVTAAILRAAGFHVISEEEL